MLDKNITQYSTEELKEVIGNFEEEYNKNSTGKVIHNEILGYVKEGIVEYALRFGAITRKIINNKQVFFVKLPEYKEYNLKISAISSLNYKREYAKEKSNELNKLN